MKKFDIVAFGEVLIDFTNVGVSQSGQKLFAQNPGGAPANVLVAAHKMGCKTSFIGKAGNDMHGQFLKETLNDESIDTTGFVLDEKYFTTLAFVDLDKHGERTFSFARKPGADTKMENSEMNLDVICDTKIFHVGSLSLTDEPSRSATLFGIEQAKKSGAMISYDPNYRASLWASETAAKEQMTTIIPDIMKISDEETDLLTSHKEPEKAAKELHEKGAKIVVVTLGGEGCYVLNNQGGIKVDGFKSNVVDTTGAGDAFWGGFLSKIALSNKKAEDITLDELKDFARFANAVASICVEGQGAIKAMPTKELVLAKL